jgi:hypothetical protein
MQNHSLDIINGNSLSLDIIADSTPSFDTPLIFNNYQDISNAKNLLLIDSIVSESQLFFDSSNENTFSVIYSNNSNREDFIQLLQEKFANGLERIAFVFHDNIKDGKTFLNQELFFSENISSYSPNTQLLIDIIKKFGVKYVDFLACNSLNYGNWIKFYDFLAKETGVIVGASNDKTGNLKHGGNWIMENTNENVLNTYFNSNINNYASTLAVTVLSTSTVITQALVNSYTWPVTVNGGTLANPVIISFSENISLNNVSRYFIIGSQYITFDGTGKTVTISNVTNYTGLIQNGLFASNGYSNVTVKNINNTISGSSTLASSGGYICQSYFGKGATNILVDNCSNSGAVNGNLSGGIGGEFIAINGTIIISNCTNSGLISIGRGGICGRYLGGQSGNATIINCSNTGNISVNFAGGICGGFLGSINGNVSISNCTNSGIISGQSAGGICASQAGQDRGKVSITNCTNSGAISGSYAGGICGPAIGYINGNVSISNCANNGVVSGQYAGGITGSQAGQDNGTVSITKSVNNGAVSGQYAGGITGPFLGINSNKLCSIINCYNTGTINGNNAGGITGSDIGYNNNVAYTSSKILIQNCYSLGNISTTCGGICGGTEGFAYINIPTVNITNCYSSYNSIVNANSQYISTSLPATVRNSIILTNVYTSLTNSWSDTNASSSLSGALSIYRNSKLYKYYSNFGEVWYSNQNNTPFSFTTGLNNVPRRQKKTNVFFI